MAPSALKINERRILQDLRGPDHGLHTLHQYSAPFFSLLKGWNWKFQCQQKPQNISRLHHGQERHMESSGFMWHLSSSCSIISFVRQCVAHTSQIPVPGRKGVSVSKYLLTLHVIFLINHNLLYHVFFPPGWVSGVAPNSYSILISNWWLLVVGKLGYFVAIY